MTFSQQQQNVYKYITCLSPFEYFKEEVEIRAALTNNPDRLNVDVKSLKAIT